LTPDQRILFLTFTNNATDRIRDALKESLTQEQRAFINVMNYHSLFYRMLSNWSRWLGLPKQIQVMTNAENVELYQRSLRELKAQGLQPSGRTPKRPPSWFSKALAFRDGYLGALEERQLRAISIVAEVKEAVHREGRVHFDDFDYYALRILESLTIREFYARKYPFIFVDEFQDINDLQYLAVKAIAGNNSWYAFGDSEQTIYRFAGASLTRLSDFEHEEGATRIVLEGNQRFAGQSGIARIADGLRGMCGTSPEKWPATPILTQDVQFHACRARNHQYGYVAQMLPSLHPGQLSIVCMLPTNNDVRELGVRLASARVHYRAMEDSEEEYLWSDAMIAGLQGAVTGSTDNLARCLDHAVGQTAFRRPDRQAELQTLVSEVAACDRLRDRLNVLTTRFQEVCESSSTESIEDAARTLLRLGSRLTGSERNLGELSRLALQRRFSDQFQGRGRIAHGVTLMTMHRGKGKEFDVAILFAPDAGGFLGGPQSDDPSRRDDLRTWHMSVSRARSKLVIFYTESSASPYLMPFLPRT
jgi:superfamily I DNA/RNA helicase